MEKEEEEEALFPRSTKVPSGETLQGMVHYEKEARFLLCHSQRMNTSIISFV